jgi:hypothetical protein
MFNSKFKTMKSLKVIIVFSVCFFVVSAIADAVERLKGFSHYEIEAVDHLNLGKGIEKVWNLTYEGSENAVTVVKRNSIDGPVYIVNSKFFEICYVASTNGFGAKYVKNAWSSVPKQITNSVLNADEIKRQQIITPSKVDDEKALGLIANYLPALLNENYLHLLN